MTQNSPNKTEALVDLKNLTKAKKAQCTVQ